jgi:hypothetical protein
MKLASFGHDLKHLVEALHVDFRLFGHDAAVRVEVERKFCRAIFNSGVSRS